MVSPQLIALLCFAHLLCHLMPSNAVLNESGKSTGSSVAAVAFQPVYVWKRNVTFISLVGSRGEDEKGVRGWSGCWQARVCEVIENWKKWCEHNLRINFWLSLKATVALEKTEAENENVLVVTGCQKESINSLWSLIPPANYVITCVCWLGPQNYTKSTKQVFTELGG